MNRETLKEIYEKYNLNKDDIFTLTFGNAKKHIITRPGIEKIQAQLGIQVNFKIEKISEDFKHVIILAHGVIMKTNNEGKLVPDKMCQSFGEVSPRNSSNPYPVAMAEKRALGRVVIKLANLFGIFSEDEAEEFKKQ
tara:strand:+ start:13384 stop:13794 length:411 start_codon:yes stop_codon:yes gene_type:complete